MNNHPQSIGRGDQEGEQNYRLCNHISKEEVSDALRKMKIEKSISSDGIPVEICKCLGEQEIKWLIDMLNNILELQKCPTNGELVQLSPYTRTRVIFRIAIIIEVLNQLVIL